MTTATISESNTTALQDCVTLVRAIQMLRERKKYTQNHIKLEFFVYFQNTENVCVGYDDTVAYICDRKCETSLQ